MITCAKRVFANAMLSIGICAGAENAFGITCLQYYGQLYNEDFNSLASSGTSSTLPIGWGLIEVGTGADTTYVASDGSVAAGNSYSFGTNSDRAFGQIGDSTLQPTIGFCVINATGGVVGSFEVGYTGETWRVGAGVGSQSVSFQYSADATALNNGTWTSVPTLNFTVNNDGSSTARDGNLPMYRSVREPVSITPSNGWQPGATLFIRWSSPYSGFPSPRGDNGFGIDDFSFRMQEKCRLDVDGNGLLDPLTDGLVLLRAMFGLTGDSATSYAIGADAKRSNWTMIRSYLNANCATNFSP